MKRVVLLALYTLVWSLSAPLRSLTFMWDLGDTLVTTDKMSFTLYELLGFDMAFYYIHQLVVNWDYNAVQKRLFETLNAIPCSLKDGASFHNDIRVPLIMHEWMLGIHKNPQAFIEKIEKELELLHENNFFVNDVEYSLMCKIIKAMFSPEKLAYHQKVIKPMTDLIKEIQNTHPEHTHIIISNWDQHSFKVMWETTEAGKILQELFPNPKHIFVSGNIHLTKPDSAIFKYVLQELSLNPKNCLFIDDQKINCNGAQECNIPSIQYTGDIHALRKAIDAYTIEYAA